MSTLLKRLICKLKGHKVICFKMQSIKDPIYFCVKDRDLL